MRYHFRTYKIIFILLFVTSTVFTQTFNMQGFPSDRPQFALSFLKPSLDSPADYTTFTGIYELSANIPINSNYNIVTSIPIVNVSGKYKNSYFNSEFDENGIGNVFLGLQSNNEVVDGTKTCALFGLFLPTADEESAPFGFYPNAYEIQKYWPDLVTIYFNYAVQKISHNGFRFGFEFGPNIFVPSGDNNADTELSAHFGLNAGVETSKIFFGLEFVGLVGVTQDIDEFEDRFVNAVNFGTAYKGESITPKLFYKIYVDEDFEKIVEGVLGIGIEASLN